MNKVMLSGRLVQEPKVFPNEKIKIINFNLANNEPNKTNYISIIAFNKIAENFLNYVKVGDYLEIEAKLNINEYTNKDNVKIKKIEIIAEHISYVLKNKTKSPNDKSESVIEHTEVKNIDSDNDWIKTLPKELSEEEMKMQQEREEVIYNSTDLIEEEQEPNYEIY